MLKLIEYLRKKKIVMKRVLEKRKMPEFWRW